MSHLELGLTEQEKATLHDAEEILTGELRKVLAITQRLEDLPYHVGVGIVLESLKSSLQPIRDARAFITEARIYNNLILLEEK